MTRRTIQLLAALVVGLVLLLVVLEESDHSETPESRLLLPDLDAHANSADTVLILQASEQGNATLHRVDDRWTVEERDGYPADTAKLRSLMVALVGATIVEQKTSNPELYGKLGVDDPGDGGSGAKVTVSGDSFSETVILGKAAQRDFRYARVADQAPSYLIDKNPEIPKKVGDWLSPDIVDVPSDRIRHVSITHADGETIVVDKDSKDLTDFSVLEVPAGKELSYASVGNGIAAVLAKLKLEDARAAVEAPAETTVVFDTWNGLRVTAVVTPEGETSWAAFSAEAVPVEGAATPAPDGAVSADTGAAAADAAGDAPASTAPDGANEPAAKSPPPPDAEAAAINERVGGWQYRLADYKKNLLTRRWKDILKASKNDD